MKPKFLIVLVSVCLTAVSVSAGERGPLAVLADAIIVRPASLAVTVVGAGLFVATLPFSVPSKSTGTTAEALVAYPARMTFSRPLGDLDALVGPQWDENKAAEERRDESKFADPPEEIVPGEDPVSR